MALTAYGIPASDERCDDIMYQYVTGVTAKPTLVTAMPDALPDAVQLRPGFAVLGVIGPDSVPHREALRVWTRAVAPGIVVRFAISLRDRAERPWAESAAASAESDVDFIDCLGQRSGASVVISHLFDAWIRHAVARYPYAAFIGRADSDAIPSPGWLQAVLAAEAARQTRLQQRGPAMVYMGSFQWYNWDEFAYRPWGWGMGPLNSRRRAIAENGARCQSESTPGCAGPFPFAQGPLLLLSQALAQWYARSEFVASAVASSIDSRLNRTSDDSAGSGGGGGAPLSLEAARARASFLRLSEPGDLDVRLFDDVFLGHALCVGDGGGPSGHGGRNGALRGGLGSGGAPNVSVIVFPPGLLADFPCNGGESGCHRGMHRYNWTAPGAPLIAHRVRRPPYVPFALELLRSAPFKVPQTATCAPMRPVRKEVPVSHCLSRGWEWCELPYKAAPMMKRTPTNRPAGRASKAKPISRSSS